MTAPAVTLRPCREDDIEALLELWRRSTVAGGTDSASALVVRLRRDAELFLLAWDGERLVGSVIGGWDGWRGNMYRLAVDAAYRRAGIARRLVAAVEERLRALGAKRITALVLIEEAGGPQFWRDAGYRPDPETERYFKNL